MIVSVVALVQTSYLSQISQICHVEVMVLSLIVLEDVCGGVGGSDDQELR